MARMFDEIGGRAAETARAARKLLIVEDNPADAALLDDLLAQNVRGLATVRHAETLAQGLALLGAEPFDAVITDLNLPDSHGFDTLRALVAARRGAQVIVLSGSIETAMIEQLRALGATDVFRKEETAGPLFARLVAEILQHGQARDRSKQLEMLLDAMPDAVLILDGNGVVQSVNQAALSLFGCRREALLGELLGFSVHEGATTEITIPRPDGPLHCEMRVAPILWGDGQGVLAAIRDVTERRLAEQALRQSEQHFSAAQDIAAMGSFVLDLASGRMTATPKFHAIFGVDADGPIDWDEFWREALSAQDIARLAEQEKAAQGARGPHAIEFPFTRGGDGAYRFAKREVDIVRDEAGKPVALIGVVRDVTDLRLAEARSQELNRELELRVAQRTEQLQLANRELQAFAYSVSHDLRTPLRAVDWLSQSVLQQFGDGLAPDCSDRLQSICASVAHMSELIEDLLAYSRIGRQRLRRVELDTNGLVEKLIGELTYAYPGEDFVIRCGDLPAVRGDPTLIRLVFQNLLDNALKFSRASAPPTIEVGCHGPASEHKGPPVFFVRDNGVGFDPRFADKLFGVFQKLHKRQSFEGTGIGLAIVQRIVQRHGGTIWAESGIGEGATFHFTLQDGGPDASLAAARAGPDRDLEAHEGAAP